MKMQTLTRIQRAKDTWDTLILALEIADFVTRGGVARSIHNYTNRPRPVSKRPADYTIKVKSERPQ